MLRILCLALVLAGVAVPAAAQENGPLRLEVTEGVIEPVAYAAPDLIARDAAGRGYAGRIARVIEADLTGTGLFRKIPQEAYIARSAGFGPSVAYDDWQAINAQALLTGAVSGEGGDVTVAFRLFDVFAETQLGEGVRFSASAASWRRLAHKVANAVYSRITGEPGYFDSRVLFVSESGPKGDRVKRLALMDYDGANVAYLTDGRSLVLAPRFGPDGREVLFTSYATGFPRVYRMRLGGGDRRPLDQQPGDMTFAPRFGPDGRRVVFSLAREGNTDLYMMNLETGERRRLTSAPSIETAPSFSPDGARLVFESDRSGSQQLYIMPAGGGEAKRISFGDGRYATPVWSPRGDLIAFTKQNAGRFHIGVMRPDGSEERLLTASFLDEGPTWAPNGRVIMFTRQSRGTRGGPHLYSVDVSGRNLRRVPTPATASDPAWSPSS